MTGKHRGSHAMSFSPDGKFFAAGGNYSEFTVHDAKTGELYWDLTLVGHGDTVLKQIEITSDSKYMISLSAQGLLRVWDLEKKKPHAVFCFSQNQSDYDLFRLKEYLQAWRTLAGDVPPDRVEIFAEFKDAVDLCTTFALAPDDKLLAIPTRNSRVHFLDWRTGKIVHTIQTNQVKTYAVKFSHNGRLLAIGDAHGGSEPAPKGSCTIELWDMRTRKPIRVCKGHRETVMHMAFSPDDKTLATGGLSDGVYVWDVETGKCKHHVDVPDEEQSRNAGVAILPDNRTLLTMPHKLLEGVHFWDLTTGKRIPQTAP